MTAFCSKPLFMSELRDVLSQPYRVKKEETPAAPYRFEGKKVLLVEDNLLKHCLLYTSPSPRDCS